MDLDVLAYQIKKGEWEDLMPPFANDVVRLVDEPQIKQLLVAATGEPIIMNQWFDIYWTASWVETLKFGGVEPGGTVLEIGAGIATNFIRAASSLLGSRGRYVTININDPITDDFLKRTRKYPINMRLIEGNALLISKHLVGNTVSFVAFNHQINDIVQTIVADLNGIDTCFGDWFNELLPNMIRLTVNAKESGQLETDVRPRFLDIINSCKLVLKRGCLMGFNNAIIPIDLKAGYSAEFLGSYIPLARKWIVEGNTDLQETTIPGFNGKWWMFFRRI